jgi:hypothetical protein
MKAEPVWTEQAREADMKALREWVGEPVPKEPLAAETEIRRLRKIIATARVRLTRIKDQSFPNIYAEACHAREILGNGISGGHGVWP